MTTIDRLRYYDGEFLRAFDFGDEQTYHMEMRRRLNRYLHLYGIVQGLQLSDNVQAGVHDVSFAEGLTIDALGREIYVFAPYTLGDQDLINNRISAPGTYDVWLRYSKTPQTPPSAGYNNCNQINQYTRWQEGFSVVLLKTPSTPFTLPGFTDADTDDPSQDQVGVLLGSVYITPNSSTAQYANVDLSRRHFIGVIAQRIQTPPCYDATSSFQFQNKQTPRNPAVSLDIEPNIFASQNVIVGPDFDLKTTPNTKVPAVNTPGAVKIAGDVFLQGTLYSSIPDSKAIPQWVGLSQYVQQSVQQFLPEVVPFVQPESVVLDPAATYDATGKYLQGAITPIPVSTQRLRNVTSSIVLAYFSQFELTDKAHFNTLFGIGQVSLSLVGQPSAAFSPNSQNGTVSVSWKAGPAKDAPPPRKCAIDNFTISGVVICYP